MYVYFEGNWIRRYNTKKEEKAKRRIGEKKLHTPVRIKHSTND